MLEFVEAAVEDQKDKYKIKKLKYNYLYIL